MLDYLDLMNKDEDCSRFKNTLDLLSFGFNKDNSGESLQEAYFL